jgi:hypothetical protein
LLLLLVRGNITFLNAVPPITPKNDENSNEPSVFTIFTEYPGGRFPATTLKLLNQPERSSAELGQGRKTWGQCYDHLFNRFLSMFCKTIGAFQLALLLKIM